MLKFDTEEGSYYLGDDPISAGDYVQFLFDCGTWHTARFEWEHLKDQRPRGHFIFFLAGGIKAIARLPPGAPARWPE